MSDEPLTNAAVEYYRTGFRFMNAMERDQYTGEDVTDDFAFEDRRSGFNYGLLDASAFPEMIRTTWDVGSGRPTWSIQEVIAVRGQRIAAIAVIVDYGNDMQNNVILSVRLDPKLQLLQRLVEFDIEARDAAIAEVDQMHAEIDADEALS